MMKIATRPGRTVRLIVLLTGLALGLFAGAVAIAQSGFNLNSPVSFPVDI